MSRLPPDTVQLVRAEAAACVKQHMRAEAKAQATIAKKEMADQLNAVLAGDRQRQAGALARLADATARLTVICDVLTDLAVEPGTGPLAALTDAPSRRVYFNTLCDQKRAEFERVAGRA